MIIHKHKFVFIHIPKCAGTSIENFFIDSLNLKRKDHVYWDDNKNQWAQHFTIRELPELEGYFKFAFVRNPWDRVVSACMYRQSDINDFLLNDYVKDIDGKKDPARHQMSQYDFLVDKNGKLKVDFVGRFENLQTDFDFVCDKLGISKHQLPHSNKTRHKHYSEYYSGDTKKMVAKRYARDIEYFGYEF
jgi:hypothetical protein